MFRRAEKKEEEPFASALRRQGTRPIARLIFFCACLSTSACSWSDADAKAKKSKSSQFGPKKQVTAPADYLGPIDPEWPPRHPQPLQVLLEASQLMRKRAKQSADGKTKPEVVVPEDHEGLVVEAGRIGDFSYLEVVLGDIYSPDDPMPLVVVLHGRGGHATIPKGPFLNEVPVRLFIPQAPDPLGSGYTWLATWTNSGDIQLLTRSLSARVDQLAPAIAAFSKMRPTLGKPILVGFSQGGILSFTLATRYPRMFSAAFPIAGWLPPALYPTPKKKETFPYIFAQHGDADKTVPTRLDRETVRALRARGLRVDYREEKGAGHVVTQQMNAETRKALLRVFRAYRESVRTSFAVRGK